MKHNQQISVVLDVPDGTTFAKVDFPGANTVYQDGSARIAFYDVKGDILHARRATEEELVLLQAAAAPRQAFLNHVEQAISSKHFGWEQHESEAWFMTHGWSNYKEGVIKSFDFSMNVKQAAIPKPYHLENGWPLWKWRVKARASTARYAQYKAQGYSPTMEYGKRDAARALRTLAAAIFDTGES